MLEYDNEKELMIIEKEVKLVKEKIHPIHISYRACENTELSKELECIDTSKVKDMSYIFAENKTITELIVSNLNTSKVTNMSAMFYAMTILKELDVSNFDTSNVTNMTAMFQTCRGLLILNVSNFDTSKVTNMSSMFMFCTSLKTLDLSDFDTSNVTTMGNMFTEMNVLEKIIGILNMQNVTNANNMLNYCQRLREVRLKNLKTNLLLNTATSLSAESVDYVLLNVQDVRENPKTLTLGSNLIKASQEALKHATDLGWTVI